MSTARSLLRKIDPDTLARVLNGTRLPAQPLKRQKPPKSFKTYRWFRRNNEIHGDVKGVWRGGRR